MPRWLVVLGVAWAAVLGSWVPAAGVAKAVSDGRELPLLAALVGAFVVGAGMTVVVGFVLARRKWWPHLWLAVLVGPGSLLFWYVVAMIAFADPNEPGSDAAAGAGVVFLAVPTVVAVALALGAGVLGSKVLPTAGRRSSAANRP